MPTSSRPITTALLVSFRRGRCPHRPGGRELIVLRRGGRLCPPDGIASCRKIIAPLAKNLSLRNQFANWSWQSASPVPKAPLPKGGWHDAAVTGGFRSPAPSTPLPNGRQFSSAPSSRQKTHPPHGQVRFLFYPDLLTGRSVPRCRQRAFAPSASGPVSCGPCTAVPAPPPGLSHRP